MGRQFYVAEVQGKINDAVRVKNEGQQAIAQLQSSISQFLSAPLSGKAYTSAKNYFQVAYTPLCRAAILSGEALVSAHKRLLSEYQSTVGSIDTIEDEILDQIRQLESLKSELTRQMSEAKTMRPDLERRYINACDCITKKREKLKKFEEYDSKSASFFDEYETCQQQYLRGLAQVQNSKAWNSASGTFDLGLLDMSWAVGINEQWKAYQDKQHGIDEKKNKELEKYNVYAVVYYDENGNPKIAWQIEDKETGYGIENTALYRYLQESGKYLDSDLIQFMTYEAYDKRIKDGWRKGVNYVTGEKLNGFLGGVVGVSQFAEDGVTWLNENELGQAIQMLGFAYASYRMTTTSGVKNVKNSKYTDVYEYKYNGYDNPGPLNDIKGQPNKNFYGGRYNVEVLKEPKVLYRAGDGSNPLGQWFTETPPNSVTNVRIDTAVKPQWIDNNGIFTGASNIDRVYKIEFPAGTKIYSGPVGNQGGIYQGGLNTNQIYINKPWELGDTITILGSNPLK